MQMDDWGNINTAFQNIPHNTSGRHADMRICTGWCITLRLLQALAMASDGHDELPVEEEEDLLMALEEEEAVVEAPAAHVGGGGAAVPGDGAADALGGVGDGGAVVVVGGGVAAVAGAAGIYAAAAALGGGARQAAADLADRRRQLQIERRQVALQMRQNDRKRQRIMLRAQGLSDDDLLEILAMRAHAKGLCFSCSLCLRVSRPGELPGDHLHGL